MNTTKGWPIEPVAIIRTPFRQKFAIPRQPNLVPEAVGEIEFLPGFTDANLLRGLEGFSHLWVLFLFHETAPKGWTATVTPPRLGGSERVGVFASRAPYRPNGLGLSVVERGDVEQRGSRLILRVRGVDLLDGTPIVDIKPYLPYADAIATATGGYAPVAPGGATVTSGKTLAFSHNSLKIIEELANTHPELPGLIRGVLLQDPRPAHQAKDDDPRDYAMWLYDYNIRWRVRGSTIEVFAIEPLASSQPTWQTPDDAA